MISEIEGLFVVIEISSGHYEGMLDVTWVSEPITYDQAVDLKHKLIQRILVKSVRIAKLTFLD